MIRIGVISDTHDVLRPQALQFLRGSHRIIHCGDICGPEILDTLARIAPVTAVRGNNDKGAWGAALSVYELVAIGEVNVYVVHNIADMNIDPRAAGVAVVLSGHSHKPMQYRRDGVLFVNPGSAGPRRFKLPISVAELKIDGASVTARLVALDVVPG